MRMAGGGAASREASSSFSVTLLPYSMPKPGELIVRDTLGALATVLLGE